MKPGERAYLPSEIRDLGWAVAQGQTDAYVFQVRFRCFPGDFPKSTYPVRLNVFWEMKHPLENGMASPADIKAMQTFEERLIQATEPDGASVLAAVLTGRGEREFVFHTKNAGDFLSCLGDMPQEAARYPIKIFSATDPGWDYVHKLVKN